jgi:hypothetical protein
VNVICASSQPVLLFIFLPMFSKFNHKIKSRNSKIYKAGHVIAARVTIHGTATSLSKEFEQEDKLSDC